MPSPIILIADDDAFSRELLAHALTRAGHRVHAVPDGDAAWEALDSADPPRIAILDRMMPGVEGIELCRRIRKRQAGKYVYVILLTARSTKLDVIAGLEAGADDYLTKPFDPDELLSRIRTGLRVIELESSLARKIDEIETALLHVQRLEGLLPICMHCKKIRDERNDWQPLESYMKERAAVTFTHSLCSDCARRHYPHAAA